MKPILVECPRRLIEGFKREAKRVFPKETYALLIGFDEESPAGRRVSITEIYYPEDAERFCTTQRANWQDAWLVDAAEHAKDVGAELVGDIHSHPWTRAEWQAIDGIPGRQMSEDDYDKFKWNRIAGICRVYETRTGKLRASVRFWPPLTPVKTKIT